MRFASSRVLLAAPVRSGPLLLVVGLAVSVLGCVAPPGDSPSNSAAGKSDSDGEEDERFQITIASVGEEDGSVVHPCDDDRSGLLVPLHEESSWGAIGDLLEARRVKKEICDNLGDPDCWFGAAMHPDGKRAVAFNISGSWDERVGDWLRWLVRDPKLALADHPIAAIAPRELRLDPHLLEDVEKVGGSWHIVDPESLFSAIAGPLWELWSQGISDDHLRRAFWLGAMAAAAARAGTTFGVDRWVPSPQARLLMLLGEITVHFVTARWEKQRGLTTVQSYSDFLTTHLPTRPHLRALSLTEMREDELPEWLSPVVAGRKILPDELALAILDHPLARPQAPGPPNAVQLPIETILTSGGRLGLLLLNLTPSPLPLRAEIPLLWHRPPTGEPGGSGYRDVGVVEAFTARMVTVEGDTSTLNLGVAEDAGRADPQVLSLRRVGGREPMTFPNVDWFAPKDTGWDEMDNDGQRLAAGLSQIIMAMGLRGLSRQCLEWTALIRQAFHNTPVFYLSRDELQLLPEQVKDHICREQPDYDERRVRLAAVDYLLTPIEEPPASTGLHTQYREPRRHRVPLHTNFRMSQAILEAEDQTVAVAVVGFCGQDIRGHLGLMTRDPLVGAHPILAMALGVGADDEYIMGRTAELPEFADLPGRNAFLSYGPYRARYHLASASWPWVPKEGERRGLRISRRDGKRGGVLYFDPDVSPGGVAAE